MSSGIYIIRLPKPPDPRSPAYRKNLEEYLVDNFEILSRAFQEIERFSDVMSTPADGRFVPSNVTTTFTYDADATTVAELGDVLGTLIDKLQDKGVIE